MKAHLETTYKDLVTIKEQREVERPNGSTTFDEVTVAEDVPCRLSFTRVSNAEQGNGVAAVSTVVKLFISPDVAIRPGSKLEVTHQSKNDTFGLSGEPALYETHQEYVLLSFGGYT